LFGVAGLCLLEVACCCPPPSEQLTRSIKFTRRPYVATGSLLFPIGHIFLNDSGVPVNAGLVNFYRTGTTTAQNTYSDSALSSANANPVVLNSSGRATTAIYGDPASGYDYRVRLSTSAAVQIWQYDDIVVDGADTATFASGSFTGTLTGYATPPTGTVSYVVFANSAGTGKLCTLRVGTTITGTSNATSFTMTGLPAACTPTDDVYVTTVVSDNSTEVVATATIAASGTTITFACDQPFSAAGFTAANNKALVAGWSITYPL
jgi:hypothetical protein